MPTYTVFLLDDEGVTIRPYVDFLESNDQGDCRFRVVTQKTVFEANAYFVVNADKVDAMVLDLQMPWEDEKWKKAGIEISRAEKEKFLYPGLWFLNRHRDEIVNRRIPVFILTNMRLDEVEKVLKEIAIPRLEQVEFARKIDTPASDFPERLCSLIHANKSAG